MRGCRCRDPRTSASGSTGRSAEAVALLEKNRVEIVDGPVPRPAADAKLGQSIYFRDPDGNLLEFLSTDG